MRGTYSGWTNFELRRLRAAHATGYPSPYELRVMLPRHSEKSIMTTATKLGLREMSRHRWLRKAHAYFARREAGLLT